MEASTPQEMNPPVPPDLISRLQAEPWRHGFLALVRRIGADPRIDPVGRAALPGHEPFRLGQQASLAFAPRELASVALRHGRLDIKLFGLGMLGPNGALPLHVTEIARERSEHRRDETLADFLDVFHHRAFTQFYRAWAAAQSAVSLDRKSDERFSFYIASLTGHEIEEIRGGPLPPHARLSASPHLIRESRNPDGLRATLENYFRVPVQISEFVFHWIELEPQGISRIGVPGSASVLAVNAFLGTTVPDRQYKFRITIGPLDFDDYLRFTPEGPDLIKLVEWVRAFFGEEMAWELELTIKPESAPPAVMGCTQQLGWSSWLGRPPPGKPVTGMCFEPERYMPKLKAQWRASMRNENEGTGL